MSGVYGPEMFFCHLDYKTVLFLASRGFARRRISPTVLFSEVIARAGPKSAALTERQEGAFLKPTALVTFALTLNYVGCQREVPPNGNKNLTGS